MAESVADMAIRLDLNYDDLNQDFVNVQQTLSSNIQRLNRENNLIDLRARIDLTGVTDAEERLQIEQNKLTQQIELTREKVRLYEIDMINAARAHGEESRQAQSRTIAYEAQRLALARLEQQLREVTARQQDFSESQSDSSAQNLSEEIDRLSNENTIIRLRTEADLSGLDAANDASQIFTIRQQALNQQIANQRAKLNAASAALSEMARRYGETSQQAQRARIEFERERGTLAQLEQQLRELNETQNESSSDSSGGGFLSNLQELPSIAGKLAGVTAAITAIGGAISTVSNSSVELIEKFRELQKQSYDLNMSFAESKDFLRELKLGGGDYGDYEGFIRGITDAFVKGEADDPEFIALSKYGAEITDATGRLKNFKEISEEVFQAWKKADAAGEGIEFLQMLGGESGIRDALQYFRFKEQGEQDKLKIFNSGIDPAELREAERALNLLTEQSDEFKDALANMVTPASTIAMQGLFEIFRSGTELVAENTEKIQRWGFILSEVVSALGELGDTPLGNFGKSIVNPVSSNLERVYNYTKKILGDFSDEESTGGAGEGFFDKIFDKINARVDEKMKAYNASLEETRKKQEEIGKVTSPSDSDPLNQYNTTRIGKYKDELEKINNALKFNGDSHAQELADLESWYQQNLQIAEKFEGEKTVLTELYNAKRAQIEQKYQSEAEKAQEESAKRTQEMLKSAADIEFEHTHSAFEKQLRDIEQWKEAQLEKATTAEEVAATIKNAAMKEADAFEKEMDRIKGKIESAQDRLARLTLSQYENDVRNAQKQYLEDIKELPKGLADTLYKAQIAQINKRRAEDKNGDYTKRPSGGGQDFGGSQFLDFTQNKGQNTKSWLDVDSAVLAQQKLLGANSRNWEDVNSNLEKASQQATGFYDSVKKAASGSENFSEKFGKTAEDIGKLDADKNLQNSFDLLGSEVTQTADKFKNASSTVQQAAKIALGWEKQKSDEEEKIKFPDEEQKSGGTIYGDDPFYSHNYERNGIKVIYGDDESGSVQGFNDSLNQASENADEFLSQFDSPTQQIESALKPLSESFQEVGTATKPLQENLKVTADATAPLTEKLNGLSSSIETISTAIQSAAEKISQIEFQQQSTPAEENYNLAKDFGGGVFDFNSLFNRNLFKPLDVPFNSQVNYQSENPASMNIDLTSAIQQITDSQSQRTIEIVTTIDGLTQAVTTSLSELSQNAGQIAQNLSNTQTQRQPPNITITVTPNINLAGAYVFDNAMKRQLTDEITSEVANAVKSAVESAATQINFSYGN